MATAATTMEFEKPIAELERQIDELKQLGWRSRDRRERRDRCRSRASSSSCATRSIATSRRSSACRSRATPSGRSRSTTCRAFTDFIELHGDRAFREDAAIVGGWARLDGETVMVIGHQRGRDTKENLQAQLRHAASRGLPQGAPPDEARREVPRPGDHVHRHAGRVGRTRRRGARTVARRSRATCSR